MGVPSNFTLAAALAIFAAAPGAFVAVARQSNQQPSPQSRPSTQSPPVELQPESRLAIVRFVASEYAKVVAPLPHGRRGFTIHVGKPLNPASIQDAARLEGTAASPGDIVQITRIDFGKRAIFFQIDNGPHKHFHWREHVAIGVGDVPDPVPVAHPDEGTGAILVLDFGRPLPEMTPDDVKRDLAPFLDFSKQQSAAVNWLDTLPPQFVQGIKDHRAIVGMDQDMVMAALGRPDRKVRQQDASGKETEDWIYGDPPARTIFVTFQGEKVIRVEVFG
ncbi:MAG: hypothetical protein WA405_04800 [Candidatus Acidiferrales bacterium]